MFCRGTVQSALGIKHVLTPGLVETQGNIVPGLVQGAGTSRPKAPGAQEPGTAGTGQRVIVQRRRQGSGVPAAGVEMDLVAIGTQTMSQVGNVGFTAAPRRQDVLVTKPNVHGFLPNTAPHTSRRCWRPVRARPARWRPHGPLREPCRRAGAPRA